MSRQVPALPFPPGQYDQRYFNELLRTLNLYFRLVESPGSLVVNNLQFLPIPLSPAGLRKGSVWHDYEANVLRIVDDRYIEIGLTGSAATTASGSL